METKAQLDFEKVRFDVENNVHLVVSLTAPKIEIKKKRPAICVIPVIDVSGSMADDKKLHYAKQSVLKLLDHLQPGDYCGLVTFASNVNLVFPPAEVVQSSKEKMKAAVEALTTHDMTAFGGGMLLGLEQLNKADVPAGMIRRVIMFTDGLANVGIVGRESLMKALEANLGSGTLSAFGYGADADQELLADLARAGKGNYAFISSPEKALTAFAKELGGLLSMYAQDIVVDVAPHGKHVITEVISDVDSEKSGDKVIVKIPEILSEETRNVVFQVKLAEQSQALPRALNVVDVKVTYVSFDEDGKKVSHSQEAKAKVTFVKEGEQQEKPTEDVDKIVAMAQLVNTQVESEKLAKAGNYAAAVAGMNVLSDALLARGHHVHASMAHASAGFMASPTSYVAGSSYRNSLRSVGTRSVGSSGMDEDVEREMKTAGVIMSNSTQDAAVEAFTGSPEVGRVTPVKQAPAKSGPEAAPAKKAKSGSLTKSKSANRW